MPSLKIVQALAANETVHPLQSANWIYERVPFARAAVDVFMQSTTAAVVATVVVGSDVQEQEGPVSSGAVAGEFPTTVPPSNRYFATGGDKILITLRETAGAVATVNLWIVITPF